MDTLKAIKLHCPICSHHEAASLRKQGYSTERSYVYTWYEPTGIIHKEFGHERKCSNCNRSLKYETIK